MGFAYLCIFIVLEEVQHFADIIYVVCPGEEFKCVYSLLPKTTSHSFRQALFSCNTFNKGKMVNNLIIRKQVIFAYFS